MASALITNVHYVDPVLPEQLPLSIIGKADALPAKVAFLDGILAPETGARLARLLQITNSYYSNMIEGQFTELADMQRAQNTPGASVSSCRTLPLSIWRCSYSLSARLEYHPAPSRIC